MTFALPLHGAEYRVSTAAQVSTIMTTAVPGDTLTMVNGTWTNANIVFAGFGTTTAPILLRAETYGGVILTGTSNLRISGRHLIVDGILFENGYSPSGGAIEFRGSKGESDSCRLTNCAIRDFNPADSMKDYKWVSLYGTHNRVDHCYFKGKNHIGTTLVVWVDSTKPNYHQIDYNYFAYRPVFPVNGAETIRVGTSEVSMFDSYTIIENNYFEECNGEIEIISNKSCENIYRYNTFVSCQGTLTLRHGNRCTVEGNFFFGNHAPNSGGIRIIGEDHKVFNNYVCGTDGNSNKSALTIMDGVLNSPLSGYFQVKRAVVAFNTFVDNKYTINIGGNGAGATLPPDSCVIANNVVLATSSPIITLTDTPTNMTWQGNIFYGASLGITKPDGIILTNPLLTIAPDGLWRPNELSPVLNSAVGSFPYITTDMDGQLRDAFYDVGADEVSTASIIRRPLTPSDVGPPSALITSVEENRNSNNTVIRTFALEQNYPNPFNPTTVISFQLSDPGFVEMKIFDVLGKEVQMLVHQPLSAGRHEVQWNASGFGSGVYFCRLQSGEDVQTTKIVLMR
jgi:poly(beta-D-mannuronate) lyase